MNFVYDLTLNFNDKYIDFYEWNIEDNIDIYSKVPIFKVQDDIIDDFIKNQIIIDKSFISRIIKISKVIILSSLNKTIGLMIDNKGMVLKKSSLSIDEEDDILSFSKIIKFTLFDYKIIKKEKNKELFLTREEMFLKKELLDETNKYFNNKEIEKLEYIYYELYNEKNNDIDIIYLKLVNLIENNSNKILLLKDIICKIDKKGTFIK